MKKKLIVVFLLVFLVIVCSSIKIIKKINVGVDLINKYVVEDIEVNKKLLEDIIVFNEEGVIIRREGNNLILLMFELILFDFDKYVVKDGIKFLFLILVKVLGENKDIYIKIDGYIDFIGIEVYNLDLFVKRVRVIKDFLIFKGVIGFNILIEGYGE